MKVTIDIDLEHPPGSTIHYGKPGLHWNRYSDEVSEAGHEFIKAIRRCQAEEHEKDRGVLVGYGGLG